MPGIFRNPPSANKPKAPAKSAAISVRCPNCSAEISIPQLPPGRGQLRCGTCAYPMVRRSDILLIIDSCRRADASASAAVLSILRQLAGFMPEAAAELGALAIRQDYLPISQEEKWALLMSAHAHGVASAREGLMVMCDREPARYSKAHCPCCGADKFKDIRSPGHNACIFCGQK